jgi:hypothetical protein
MHTSTLTGPVGTIIAGADMQSRTGGVMRPTAQAALYWMLRLPCDGTN